MPFYRVATYKRFLRSPQNKYGTRIHAEYMAWMKQATIVAVPHMTRHATTDRVLVMPRANNDPNDSVNVIPS